MKITLLVVGKTDASYLRDGMKEYLKRLKHYVNFEMEIIPDIKKGKNTSPEIQKAREGELILSKIAPGKEIHLFDEKGRTYSSVEFSSFLEKKMINGLKELI
ncbi:MAG TPA: 23S rRNA (pseudouridine(1915)-N(3))-methyltransferase RlmH, partial [Draconibacterium sp.]|nr:23S rRNA (pseudouridine(1915)-N(3))-methyltransferase RlmH [Draconibacterium sp.]